VPSTMRAESLETPAVLRRLLASDDELYAHTAELLRREPPSLVATIGRGSSNHAGVYGGYLITALLGVPAAPLAPSLATLYAAPLRLSSALALAVSQSGRSPDLVRALAACAAGGARTLAVVNDLASPVAAAAGTVLPLHAGEERSVAATKTFVASLASLARLAAHWAQDKRLLTALAALPDALSAAAAVDAAPLLDALAAADRMLVIGRGPTLGIALEAGLKLKEGCGIQAEAFSEAETRHGPLALVGPGYPVLILAPRGPVQAPLLALAADAHAAGAEVVTMACGAVGGAEIAVPAADDPWLDPLVLIHALHLAIEPLAARRGCDPDHPPHVGKVTLTV
jgi:glucosamine--fructose-6-phosphate aminotransferase (isomerizing)